LIWHLQDFLLDLLKVGLYWLLDLVGLELLLLRELLHLLIGLEGTD
jgi:hypothetical protein